MPPILRNAVLISVFLVSLGVTFTTWYRFSDGDDHYTLIWLLPVSFMVSYPAILFAAKGANVKGTFLMYLALTFLQSVAYPMALSMMPINYQGRWYFSLSRNEISTATMVLSYSNVFNAFMAIAIRVLAGQSSGRSRIDIGRLVGSKVVYLAVILTALGLAATVGLPRGLISFFSASSVDRDLSSSFFLLVRQIIWIGLVLLFVVVLDYSRRNYNLRGSQRYYWLALLCAIMIVGTVIGGRRSVQLFTAALAIWMVASAFPKYSNRTIAIIVGSGLLAIASITIARGSIVSALQVGGGSGGLSTVLVEYLQVYAGGVDSIATAMRLSYSVAVGFQDFLFDFARLTFGLSFFLKEKGVILSEIYNDFVYEGDQRTGQVIFAVSYGYLIFGALGAPLVTTMNLIYSAALETMFRRTQSIELQFVFGYCFFRVAFNFLVNTPTIHTIVSLQLITFGLVIGGAALLKGIDEQFRKR